MIENHGTSTISEALRGVLRASTGLGDLELDGEPRPLTGGFWAELLAFRLPHPPDGWPADLVLRLMPDAGIAAKETVVQREVALQGFPTPRVHLAGGPGDGLGRSFMVMDLASGGPLLDGLGGGGAVLALPRLARQLPELLAATMAQLHQLDVTPVRAQLGRASGIREVVASLGDGAARCARPDLERAAGWLLEHPPATAPDVVCHGDLHPFNLLVDATGRVTVLDWSASVLAPALYDVAFTSLILAEPPVVVPAAARPFVRFAGRVLARRFLRAYAHQANVRVDAESLRWHQGVVCLRALVEAAGWSPEERLGERRGHPWSINGPVFGSRLSALTGYRVVPSSL